MNRLALPQAASGGLCPQAVRERAYFSFHASPSTSGRACVQCAAQKRKSKPAAAAPAPPKTEFKGFGQQPKVVSKPLKFEKDEGERNEDEAEDVPLVPEYRMYVDGGYAAPRFVHSVELARHDGVHMPLLTASADLLPGELVAVSPAIGFLEGGFQEVPEVEDLQVAMLENGLGPAQRRVLNLLDDLTRPLPPAEAQQPQEAQAQQQQVPSLSTLDVKFWAGRGKDTSAPDFNGRRLRELLARCAASDTEQDPAAAQARHVKPVGFAGLWPEHCLMGHSCAPNASTVVVGDRMFIHASADLPKGEPITRNYLGPAIFAPLSVRQSALQEAYGTACRCERCTLEASVSEELRDTLEDAHSWYLNEASVQWNAANAEEDMALLKNVMQEAQVLVGELEDAIAAEPGLDGTQQDWLRAGAYELYDLLVSTDELVNGRSADPTYLKLSLDIIAATLPGSDSHVQVALKAFSQRQAVLEGYKDMLNRETGGVKNKRHQRQLQNLVKGVVVASEDYLSAQVLRYGILPEEVYDKLTDGLHTYGEALAQFSIMRAQGVNELTREMEVDGIQVQIVDRMEVSGGTAAEGEVVRKVVMQDGMQVMLVDKEAPRSRGAAGGGSSSSSMMAAADQYSLDDDDGDDDIDDEAAAIVAADQLLQDLGLGGLMGLVGSEEDEEQEDDGDDDDDGDIIDIEADDVQGGKAAAGGRARPALPA